MGVAVDMGIAVGFGVEVGGAIVVDAGVAICEPEQPESARQKEIKTMNIRLYSILMVTFR